jgi:hypothetical protein
MEPAQALKVHQESLFVELLCQMGLPKGSVEVHKLKTNISHVDLLEVFKLGFNVLGDCVHCHGEDIGVNFDHHLPLWANIIKEHFSKDGPVIIVVMLMPCVSIHHDCGVDVI